MIKILDYNAIDDKKIVASPKPINDVSRSVLDQIVFDTTFNKRFCFDGRKAHTQQHAAFDCRRSVLISQFQKRIDHFIDQAPEPSFQFRIGKILQMRSACFKIVRAFHARCSFTKVVFVLVSSARNSISASVGVLPVIFCALWINDVRRCSISASFALIIDG